MSNSRDDNEFQDVREQLSDVLNTRLSDEVKKRIRNELARYPINAPVTKSAFGQRTNRFSAFIRTTAAAVVGVAIIAVGAYAFSRQSVEVTSPSSGSASGLIASLQRQVQLLQEAVTPKTARDAAITWAKALQSQNGALQFAILIPQLQNKMKAEYESWNWSPGVSSPWIEKYTVGVGKKISATKYQFVIVLTLTDSTHDTTTGPSTIVVTQLHGNWYVSDTGGYGAPIKVNGRR